MKILTIMLFTLLVQRNSLASSFQSCLLNVEIISSSDQLLGSGSDLSLKTWFKPEKNIGKKDSDQCKLLVGKKIEKTLLFKSKQYIPFIKTGNFVTVDYSHFIIDKNDPSLNMEVWKVVNIKTQRSDHDD